MGHAAAIIAIFLSQLLPLRCSLHLPLPSPVSALPPTLRICVSHTTTTTPHSHTYTYTRMNK